jgi:hypothetical protein
MFDHSMRRSLHKDVKFHLYKMVVGQELSEHDMANYSTVAEQVIEMLSKDVIILMTDETYFWLCQ